ncbi:hypothetical protein PUNSTDRAFT_129265 [Punctularia strigosozonata HHB-11173 SS5]|uniref:uncharacterized protein n=1 Tax=Punctularia strigosozonata (strain HHB-11173) TaxID=741275 RepID=UPI00044169C7|nr:uncharacterized protein PUNSTDRAFT_129265 [Punctularia strigosozonata HHB-11173 SS5]EIN13586.1 hypothetical protein PUNSTDRAFT_129265 [Punctularia strigosozonata HHB-11173 SS5]
MTTVHQINTSQDIVRALRAPVDPPKPGGPSKIEIARTAWNDGSLNFPQKREFLLEYVLSRFLKEKNAEEHECTMDPKYWALLADVASMQEDTSSSNQHHVPPSKFAFTPILNKIPLEGVLALYGTLPRLEWGSTYYWIASARIWMCFAVCFKEEQNFQPLFLFTILRESVVSSQEHIERRCRTLRVSSTFVDRHLQTWVACLVQEPIENRAGKSEEHIYEAGVETLFGLETLRDKQLVSTLQDHPAFFDRSYPSYRILPRLFSAYVQAIRRHRGALFGGGSATDAADKESQWRTTSLAFLDASRHILASLGGEMDTLGSWRVASELLEIVERENLFRTSDDSAPIFTAIATWVVEGLISEIGPNGRSEHQDAIVVALTHLAGIDHDIVSPHLATILPVLLAVPSPHLASRSSDKTPDEHGAALSLLAVLIDFHTRSRTMPTYFQALLESTTRLLDTSDLYTTTLSSVVVSAAHLDLLAKSTTTYLNPGQVTDTTEQLLRFLQQQWSAYPSTTGDMASEDPIVAATAISVTCRLAATVLTSLPLKSILPDSQAAIIQILQQARSNFLGPALSKALKHINSEKKSKRSEEANDVGWNIVTAALVRFHYTLAMSTIGLTWEVDVGDKICTRMRRVVVAPKGKPASCEAEVECVRYLFALCAANRLEDSSQLLDAVLDHLDQPSNDSNALEWNGLSCQLATAHGPYLAPIALLRLILDRWLPLVELLATEEQLKRLIQSCITIHCNSDAEHGITSRTVLSVSLRTASIWELPRLRSALQSVCEEKTGFFSGLKEGPSLEQRFTGTSTINKKQVRTATAVFHILLYAPAEYLSRPARIELVQRALAADYATGYLLLSRHDDKDIQDEFLTHSLIFRSFASYAMTQSDEVMQLPSTIIKYLIKPSFTKFQSFHMARTEVVNAHASATLQIVESQMTALLRRCQDGDSADMEQIVRYLIQHQPGQVTDQLAPPTIFEESLVRFMALTSTKYAISRMPATVVNLFKDLYDARRALLEPRVRDISTIGARVQYLSGRSKLIRAWAILSAFERWLGKDADVPRSGADSSLAALLAHVVISKTAFREDAALHAALAEYCSAVLEVAVEEMHSAPKSHRKRYMEILLAIYVALYEYSDASNGLFAPISKAINSLSVEEFNAAAQLIAEALESRAHREGFVHLSQILVREAPEGTMRLVQNHVSSCLVTFISDPDFWQGPISLSVQALRLLSAQCSNKPAFIRQQDMDGIWAFLAKFLQPSAEHLPTTCVDVFEEIVSIINSLIRLRRDLINTTLPHLGFALRFLVSSLRNVRPELGPRQTRMVTNTLPRWLSVPARPLGVPEAATLARLLTGLTAKTIPRNHLGSGEDTQQAKSMAHAFSKHAVYVIQSYIEVLDDPLCVLRADMRKALQPGLFALCDMTSEHMRDSLMVSALDASGKTIMKALWKEYEKQRYVGKG